MARITKNVRQETQGSFSSRYWPGFFGCGRLKTSRIIFLMLSSSASTTNVAGKFSAPA
ncbi:hypothetical protein SALBM135S_05858 [Streptomyces alboniger]